MKAGWQLLIERFPEARLLWDVPGPRMAVTRHGHSRTKRASANETIGQASSWLRAYSVNGCVVIVHDYPGVDGWQVYTPTTESGEITRTMDAVDARSRGVDYDWRA